MPIPPRPIPSNRNRVTRPGSSVPRKSPLSLDKSDWRSEISLISTQPRSLPAQNRIAVLDRAKFEKVVQVGKGVEDVLGKREVGVEGLIIDGRGRREKRVTTATTLGFDFIPNPSILALPESTTPKSSLLAPSLNAKGGTSGKAGPIVLDGRDGPALSGTPKTPALIPVVEDDEVDVLEDDDWEHVTRGGEAVDIGGREDEEDDGDLCVLGELELEDAPFSGKTGPGKTRSKDVSYAAAAIGSRAVRVSL